MATSWILSKKSYMVLVVYSGKPRVAQWFSSYYYIRLRSVFPMAEVCTVGKVYASIFSSFRKRVVNIASSLLRPISNERSGNFTSGFSAEIAMLTKLLRKYGFYRLYNELHSSYVHMYYICNYSV